MTKDHQDRKLPCETGTPEDGQPVVNGERKMAQRAGFASAIAKSEFGRHYWDDSMVMELIAARKRHRKPK